jgi:hypothetical protein
MSVQGLLLLLALIVFVVAAFGVQTRVNLVAAGLALLAAALLVGTVIRLP